MVCRFPSAIIIPGWTKPRVFPTKPAAERREVGLEPGIEIEKDGRRGGKIVWEWHVWDHLIQDRFSSKANYGDPEAHPERVDVHATGRRVPAFWNHVNSIAYNAELDQIMLSVRGSSELWVIDHSTTTEEASSHRGGRSGRGGGLLYRWGNPLTYGAGGQGDQMLFQQHDTHWIEPGCPGAGNILIFNNGLGRGEGRAPRGRGERGERRVGGGGRGGYSSVDELVPPVDDSGNYVRRDGSAFGPKELAWTYFREENREEFFAEAISGAQRLPNGNTLICDGTHGVFFEVTPEGETVWEYVCPVVKSGPLRQGEKAGLDHRGHNWNAAFDVHRYAPDYPGLKGRDLTPGKVIELPAEGTGDPARGDDEARPGEEGRGDGERRGGRGRRGGQDRSRGESRLPVDEGEPRQPWLVAHADELDGDGDGVLTLEEG
ncbi:MAG: hypothetical protein GY722_03450 [bacterium]|nr:hypothetical protein [bacterium]